SHMVLVGKKLAKKLKIDKSGYRLIINTNSDAGQSVFHIHLHLIGGEKLKNI
ncbi:MAG: HIT domain-containing protein, partial [Actinomycetota bacterium]|nr:HIT domain-containing protein [Actinomycetota bacterium]